MINLNNGHMNALIQDVDTTDGTQFAGLMQQVIPDYNLPYTDPYPYIPWRTQQGSLTTYVSVVSNIERAYHLVQALMKDGLLKLRTIAQFTAAVDTVSKSLGEKEQAYKISVALMKAKSVETETIEEFMALVEAVAKKL